MAVTNVLVIVVKSSNASKNNDRNKMHTINQCVEDLVKRLRNSYTSCVAN